MDEQVTVKSLFECVLDIINAATIVQNQLIELPNSSNKQVAQHGRLIIASEMQEISKQAFLISLVMCHEYEATAKGITQ